MVEKANSNLTEKMVNSPKQLTKRNNDYIFHLKKALRQLNFPEEKKEKVIIEVTSKLLIGQKQGKTAKQIFGTVTEYASSLNKDVVVKKNEDPKLMLLDNILMMFGMLAALNTIMVFFSSGKQQVAANGIISLVVMAIVGGSVFLLMYHLFYKYEKPDVNKAKKPKWWVSTGLFLIAIVLWMLLMSLVTLIPKQFNPILPTEIIALLAVLSLVAWRYVHKHFNIESSFMPRKIVSSQSQNSK